MFTRKQHYKAIAEIINHCSGPDIHWKYQTTHTQDLVCCLADYFKQDNPHFDRERFMKACGLN